MEFLKAIDYMGRTVYLNKRWIKKIRVAYLINRWKVVADEGPGTDGEKGVFVISQHGQQKCAEKEAEKTIERLNKNA